MNIIKKGAIIHVYTRAHARTHARTHAPHTGAHTHHPGTAHPLMCTPETLRYTETHNPTRTTRHLRRHINPIHVTVLWRQNNLWASHSSDPSQQSQMPGMGQRWSGDRVHGGLTIPTVVHVRLEDPVPRHTLGACMRNGIPWVHACVTAHPGYMHA